MHPAGARHCCGENAHTIAKAVGRSLRLTDQSRSFAFTWSFLPLPTNLPTAKGILGMISKEFYILLCRRYRDSGNFSFSLLPPDLSGIYCAVWSANELRVITHRWWKDSKRGNCKICELSAGASADLVSPDRRHFPAFFPHRTTRSCLSR